MQEPENSNLENWETYYNMGKNVILQTWIQKAVSTDDLFGCINPATREWKGLDSAESESNLRKIFKEAEKNSLAIIFIDEVDVHCRWKSWLC